MKEPCCCLVQFSVLLSLRLPFFQCLRPPINGEAFALPTSYFLFSSFDFILFVVGEMLARCHGKGKDLSFRDFLFSVGSRDVVFKPIPMVFVGLLFFKNSFVFPLVAGLAEGGYLFHTFCFV